jgi:hypothetical protein
MVEVLSFNNISILRDFNSGKVTWQLQWHKKPHRYISFIDVNEKTLDDTEKIAIDTLIMDMAHDINMFKKDLNGLYKKELSLKKAVV